MRGSSSLVIIVIGLLVLWLGVTGKFDCFGGVLKCMTQPGAGAPEVGAAADVQTGKATTPGTIGKSDALARVSAKLGGPGGLFATLNAGG